MRHSGYVTKFAQNLGDLVGHDIMLMRLSDPLERERLKAEVGTEHVPLGRWFRMAVEGASRWLGRGDKDLDPGACCRSAPIFQSTIFPRRSDAIPIETYPCNLPAPGRRRPRHPGLIRS